MRKSASLAAGAICLISMLAQAQAQTVPAAAAAPSFDLTTLTTPLLQLLGTFILAVGTWATKRLLDWLGVKTSAQAAANLDQALEKAVTYGIQQAQNTIKEKGWDHIVVRNEVLDKALPYMIERFSDSIKTVGADPTAKDHIRAALDRAFPQAVAKAADSPATPPKTAPQPQTIAELAGQPGVQQQIVEKSQP